MIDRGNWKYSKAYLEYRQHVDQISQGSLNLERTYLRYLLIWSQETSFSKAPSIRPTFQEFLLSYRLDGSSERLSTVSITKTLATARRFYTWLSDFRYGHSGLKQSWINTLKFRGSEPRRKIREAVSFDEIISISNAPVRNLQERRIRAAACFWYLSGIRIGAFVSLRLKAVDIEIGDIKQFPGLGVRTKNNKHATTFLLPIPELLEVVNEWDKEIRGVLSQEGFWFAPFLPGAQEIDSTNITYKESRDRAAREDLRGWLSNVGLPYSSPHKFRHGHIQWGLMHSKDRAQFKAISENVMHSNTRITDEIYSSLKETEIKSRILSMGDENGSGANTQQVIEVLETLLENLKSQ